MEVLTDRLRKATDAMGITDSSPTATSHLLKGGTVLIHDQNDHVQALRRDILVENGMISQIEGSIATLQGVPVIDCTDKIISPGFIDTHHHVWQSLLKGRYANEQLLPYLYKGNFQSSHHSAIDIFYGQLAGCLEMLAAGTTTVVDHAHMNYSPEHTTNALSATVSSGIRSVFCYTPTARIESWNPLVFNNKLLEPWIMELFDDLATKAPFGQAGQVTLGFAFDGWVLPKEVIMPLIAKVKGAGVEVITTHAGRDALHGWDPLVNKLADWKILDSSFLMSHSCGMDVAEAEIYKKYGVFNSSTPDTEMQMAMGPPICFNDELGMQRLSSLGVDCHSNNTASIPAQMRLVLQSWRCINDETYRVKQKIPRDVYKTVEEAFNLGTIQGARAIKMEDKTGSIAVGKRADLVIFDALSPAMTCAAQQDPVAAIVLHGSPADIDAVLVDGRIVKEDGRLLPTIFDEVGQKVTGSSQMEWTSIAAEMLKRSAEIKKKVDTLDWEDADKTTSQRFRVDPNCIVTSL